MVLLCSCRKETRPLDGIAADSPPSSGDAFVEASLGDASYLNPLLASDSSSGGICSLVYNGLVKYDKDLKLVGELAESWEVRNGGLEILFHLRKDVRWHDGEPFTSADVKYTYDRLVDPQVKTPYGSDFQMVASVEAPDALTVRVRYKTPFAPALESWGMGIIPRHVFEDAPEGSDFNKHPANRAPIGTGPYRFTEWRTDEKIVLTANPDYFEGPPFLRRYIFRIIPDLAVQFLELRQENIDMMGLTPDQYRAYPEFFRNYNKFRYPAFSYTYFAFNLNSPLFNDKRVRKALAHAIRKDEIIDGVLLGFGRPATGPYPPTSWAFNESVRDYEPSDDKAKALLAEAGWKDGDGDGILEKEGRPFEFTLITNQGNKLRELSAIILQSHFSRIGIKMNLRVLEWSSFLHNYVDKKNFDAVILGWNLSRDPDQYGIWHSSQRGEGQYNFVDYVNPRVDELLEKGRRIFDQGQRKQIYREIHSILADDLPYIFLYYPESLPTVHKRVRGPRVAPAGLGWNFREWFVPKEIQKYQYASQG